MTEEKNKSKKNWKVFRDKKNANSSKNTDQQKKNNGNRQNVKDYRVNYLGLKVRNSKKVLGLNRSPFPVMMGDKVMIETNRGTELAEVVLKKAVSGAKSNDIKLIKIHRHAKRHDLDRYNNLINMEKEASGWSKNKAEDLKLPIRISRVEFIYDMKKAIVFFRNSEDGNPEYKMNDFEKSFVEKYNVKVDFRNMGSRGEAKVLDGCGSCGKPLCCSTFLTKSNPVTVKMAKEQGLPINIPKLSGCCGRLMCCLRYEKENYQRGKLVLDSYKEDQSK